MAPHSVLRGLIVVVLANVFNVVDLVTTVYAINVLGFREVNIVVDRLIRDHPVLYAIFKLGSLFMLSLVYVVSSKSDNQFVVGINRGCILSFYLMCMILGLASILNVWQILFNADVSSILVLVSKIIPTLELR